MKTFKHYSKKIGENRMLTQGPGGNTSTKKKESIFIKKSGSFLKNSQSSEIFQEVNLSKIRDFYQNEKSDKKFLKMLSIETPIHIMLTDNHIFHYHSILSIIISAIFEENILTELLKRNNIHPISYERPGYNLAVAIKEKESGADINSYFLKNHGMIVSGNNLKKIYEKIMHLEHIFQQLIDFEEFNNLSSQIEFFTNEKGSLTVKNLRPHLNFEKFNDKYFFPDHAVFVPFKFKKRKKSTNNDPDFILFDDDYLYINSSLNSVQQVYLEELLKICFYIDLQQIHSFIPELDGKNLKISDDEVQRIKINS
jgi:ribulose-5-phosphate 4-epimerase/fuculose-1-phosphate aldolase